jgi:hypothetical protein
MEDFNIFIAVETAKSDMKWKIYDYLKNNTTEQVKFLDFADFISKL